MLIKNKDYEIEILRQGIDGEGIGVLDNMTIFINGALTGELVMAKVILVKKTYAVGKLISIIKPSKDRENPICKVYARCGGCTVMHQSYESQLLFKEKKVYDNLERIGGLNLKEINCSKIIGMESPYRYRNKVIVPVREEKGEIKLGFFARKSHSIIEFEECFIQFNEADEITKLVKGLMIEKGIKAYDEEKGTGDIRDIMIRKGFNTGEIMVIIIALKEKINNINYIIEEIKKVKGVKSIFLNINNKRTNVALGEKSILLWGNPIIQDKIGELYFNIGPKSFFQVNPEGTFKLYSKALELGDIKEEDNIIDAYCGAGTISLFLANKAKKVIGVEIVPQAIENAEENMILNGIKNASFICGKSEEEIPKIIKKGEKIDLVVVDPPRKGCEKILLESIAKAKIKKMVYVSCDSATLGRDVKIMEELGYRVTEVQPLDMFPETGHVETIVALHRKDT